jgi:hypothetical protein
MLLAILFSCLLVTGSLSAQDGSDITYVPADKLTKEQIGKVSHLDFGKDSFGIGRYLKAAQGDEISVKLSISKTPITFVEFRSDDGFNNWFQLQYLQSKGRINGSHLRWIYNKILDFDKDYLYVEAYFKFVDRHTEKKNATFVENLRFKRSEVATVLIKYER